MSMPNNISVSGSFLNMTKVWENSELAIQSCKVALPSKDIPDPSTVFRCTSVGSISVL